MMQPEQMISLKDAIFPLPGCTARQLSAVVLGVASLLAACGDATTEDLSQASAGISDSPPVDYGTVDLPESAILHHLTGGANGDWFGYAVCGLGDVNGDSVPDFAVGAHQNQNYGDRPAPTAPPGYINVYSGKDGSLLYVLHSSGSKQIDGSDDHFGFAMSSIQDQDGDGVRDILAGAYLFDAEDGKDDTFDENTGGAFIFSGSSGKLLKTLHGVLWGDRYGYTLSGCADLDGDGREDLLIGVEKTDGEYKNEGSLQVFAAGSYERLVIATGPGTEAHLACSLTRTGDVDGDQLPDIAGGAFMYSPDKNEGREVGWAGVYSSKSGELLHSWSGARMDHLGFAVTWLDDVNGDGVGELVAGAQQSGWISDFTGPGYVRVYSCADGAALYELRGEHLGDQFGWCVATAADHDGDGLADLLVGAPAAVTVNRETMTDKRGQMYLFSGRDGAPLGAVRGLYENDQFGVGIADIGDIDGDGVTDILVGACENNIGQTRPGYAVVISGAFLAGVKGD